MDNLNAASLSYILITMTAAGRIAVNELFEEAAEPENVMQVYI